MLVLCLIGAFFSRNLPVAIFPDLTAPRIIVTADSGDTPIPSMLANVTRPLESAVAGVPGITKIQSLTEVGSAELDVNFQWGTDMPSTLQQVEGKLNQALPGLPDGTTLQAERLNPSVFPIMGYSLYSGAVRPEELRRAALIVLRPRLLRVPGVQQVNVMGGDTPDYDVTLNPSLMLARGVTVQNVVDALARTNEISSVGTYDRSFLRQDVMVSGLLKGPDDIAAVTVAVKNRIPVSIGQIGSVRRGDEVHTVETSGDGRNAVLIDIVKQPSGNTIRIADDVRVVLGEAASAMPSGVTISNFYDQSQIVRESQSSVLEAIVVGGVLALLVLMLFLGNLRTASIVLIILPITILITFALMKLLGQTMNIMTLGALAIALGLVIDDGIVVVESIFHELESGKTRRDAIGAGLHAITPAMVGSSMTTMAAFLPLTMLSGLTGQFFGPLAIVMVATLAVSLVLALLLTPILADYLLPERSATSHGPVATFLAFVPGLFAHVARGYERLLTGCLRGYGWVTVLLIPVAVGAGFLYTKVETGFFPEFDEGGFILDYQMPYGTSLAETSAEAGRIESILAATPEVAAWSRRTGAQLGFDITTQDSGDMSVRLRPNRARTIDAVMDDVRERVQAAVPAAQVDFHQILQDNIGDIAGSPSPVEVKIFGDDPDRLEDLATQVDDIVAKTPGVVDDASGIVVSSPETVIDVDTQHAQRYGLTADDIRQSAQAGLQGIEPTSIQEGEQQVGIRVHVARPAPLVSDSSLAQLPIASPVTGGDVSLGSVAAIRWEPGALIVSRENQRQMIAVTAGLSGRDLGSATRDIRNRIAARVRLPAGYTIEYGGLYESQQQSFADLAVVLITTFVLVFLMLVVQLRSFSQSIALVLAALLSLFGVLAGLCLTRTPLNISSMTGAVMIVGIVTENGIVLFDFMNGLLRAAPHRPLRDVIVEAGVKRLRPILMTTIGAILALLPLALGVGAGAALQKPLAIAVIGGLTVSTFFTLIAAPVLYTLLQRLAATRLAGRIAQAEVDFEDVERGLAE